MSAKKILFLFSFFIFTQILFGGIREINNKPSFDDEILVEYKNEFGDKDIDNFYSIYKFKPDTLQRAVEYLKVKYELMEIPARLDGIPFVRYKVKDKENLIEIVKSFQKLSFVNYAQPNYKRYALYTPIPTPIGPNDWYYQQGAQYGFNLVKADQAFTWGFIDPGKNKTVIVAVLDTGVRTTHNDLRGLTITGYNALNPALPPDDDSSDGGHGTHVAGIISAETNNNSIISFSMAGAAYTHSSWTAKVLLMPIKVLDSKGDGYDSDVYAGVKWAVDHGAKVINYSFGSYDPSPVLQNAVNYAFLRGCINVAAAGNDSINAYYPASYSNVISVASCDENDLRSNFSNYGKIDVTAPGENILSTGNLSDNDYSEMSGTSFAAPFVSALAALLLLKYDTLDPVTIRRLIEQTADDIGASGYDKYTGWGRINFVRAFKQNFNPIAKIINTYSWPNPFSPEMDLFTNITFIADEPSDVTVIIYDAAGDTVWKKDIDISDINIGQNFIRWDGKNQNGKMVGSGTYFYVLKTKRSVDRNKIVVLH